MRVPTPVGKDDSLGMPCDHSLDRRPQPCFVLPEREAHITWHPPIWISDASDPGQPPHQPGACPSGLEVLDQVREDKCARAVVEEDDLGHEISGYGERRDLPIPRIAAFAIELPRAEIDASGTLLPDAGCQIHLSLWERGVPLWNPTVMQTIGADDPAGVPRPAFQLLRKLWH